MLSSSPPQLARLIAQHVSPDFLQNQTSGLPQTSNLVTPDIPNRIIGDSVLVPDKYGNTALYVYNYTNDSGFVVISADVKHEPICAYVTSGKFEADTVPSMYIEWFDATVENIEMVRDGSYNNTARANYAWYDLLHRTNLTHINDIFKFAPIEEPPPGCDDGWVTIVRGPLLATTWGQRCSYNEQCPANNCFNPCPGNASTLTGCVATAMSQVLRYWAHTNQYSYNYVSMPAAQGNGEVQRMMHDAGVSVDMNYGCQGTGSSAHDHKVDNALKDVFNFSSADGPTWLNQANYTASSYLTVKSNLDNSWPVILGGYAHRRNAFLGIIHIPEQGHTWVCDGYWSTQNHCYGYLMFHMNWGWHEQGIPNDFNGWFLFNVWNPDGRTYLYARDYIYNIHP
jgi:hypothetical protein